MSKGNLKDLRNDETIWWENFRLFFLHTHSCCDLLFFEEFYDVDFSVFSSIIWSLAEVTYGINLASFKLLRDDIFSLDL